MNSLQNCFATLQSNSCRIFKYAWISYLVGTVALGYRCYSLQLLPFTFCLLLSAFLISHQRRRNKNFHLWDLPKVTFILLLIGQTIGWIACCIIGFYSFKFNNFDTGIFANLTYHFFATGHYYSSILEMHGFADHFTPALALLSPLYAIFPSFLLFPMLKIVAYAVAALILADCSGLLLKENSEYRFVVPILFLLNRSVCNWMMMEFQPSSLAIPFFIAALMYAFKENYGRMGICLFVIMPFKEHLGVCWIVTGLYIIFFKRRTGLGITVAVSGIVLSCSIYGWIMPCYAHGPVHHNSRFGPLTLLDRKFQLLINSLLSVSLLPLLQPLAILICIPAFAVSLMSNDKLMTTLDFHYHDVGITALFFFSIYGLKNLVEGNFARHFRALHKRFFTSWVPGICLILIVILNNRFPAKYILANWPDSNRLHLLDEINQVREMYEIDPRTNLFTQENIGPHFFRSANLHSILSSFLVGTIPPHSVVVLAPTLDPQPLTAQQMVEVIKNLDDSPKLVRVKAFREIAVWEKN